MANVPAAHPLVTCVEALEQTLTAAPTDAWDGLDVATVRQLVGRLARAEARLQAHQLRAARRLEAAGAARQVGATSTGDLLARDFGGDRRAGDRLVRTAERLEAATRTQRALEEGRITLGQSQVIADAMHRLPAVATAEQRDAAEQSILRDADVLSLKDLRRRADRLPDAYAPPDQVDAIENATLVARERRARQNARFRMWDNRDGTWSGDFRVPEASADMLRTALDAIGAPRRQHLQPDEAAVDHATRMGRAFADLCTHLPGDQLPAAGGVGATLTVNLDLDTLTEGVKASTFSTGTRLSAGQTRQLACRVGLIPQVFGGDPVPLDLGREERLFNRHQRIALQKRDRGCSFPRCDRPPQWCETHHVRPWKEGGSTNLRDATLECPHHHHQVHDEGWSVRINPVDGVAEYQAPGTTTWQRNHRWTA